MFRVHNVSVVVKKAHLAERTGREVSMVIQSPWLTVKESALNNAGLGLFAARRFEKGEVVTIYHAPKIGGPVQDCR